jgi:hypothetical protein
LPRRKQKEKRNIKERTQSGKGKQRERVDDRGTRGHKERDTTTQKMYTLVVFRETLLCSCVNPMWRGGMRLERAWRS